MDGSTTANNEEQQFERIRKQGAFYIDKTGFIKEWWDGGSNITLITRPYGFGKTLNMSMVECFFSNKYAGRTDLFEGLAIWNDERYRKLQGTYPVIFLSFAGVKAENITDMKTEIKTVISDAYETYRVILESDKFDERDREFFESVNERMADARAHSVINTLCIYLEKYYGKQAIVLLDGYDAPMQEAKFGGYWDEAAIFFRNFFVSTFKANWHLHRGIITGITNESDFSDANNLDVVTTTSDRYATSFGFTEEEVFKTLDAMGFRSEKEEVKRWYGDFTVGKYANRYNPRFISAFIEEGGQYAVCGAGMNINRLVNSLIQKGSTEIKQMMEILIKGGSFKAILDEPIVYGRLDGNTDAVCSLLFAAGYLKVLEVEIVGKYKDMLYTMALTNMQVLNMFEDMINRWFEDEDTKAYYNEFINSLLNDNVEEMNTSMNKVMHNTFSSFDCGNHPEQFYHGFVLEMVVNLADRYEVCSNYESGYGRYDVMIKPIDKTEKAFAFEFKVLEADDDEVTLEDTLANAHKQIDEKEYEAELVTEGFVPGQIRKYGFAFRGMECLIG